MRSASFVLLAATLGGLGHACSRRPADPVSALLGDLEAAAEARDAAAFTAGLSPQFRDAHGLGHAETRRQLERWFAGYETVALEIYGVEVERTGATARVRCVVEFRGQGRRAFGLEGLLPPSAVYRFTLETGEEPGGWRVRAADYEPVPPSS
jgi:hypothetical protein